MSHVRMDPAERRRLILTEAVKLAKRHGFKKATRVAIAAQAGVTPGLVGVYFGKRDALRNAIMQAAIDARDVHLLRNGLDIGAGKGMRIPKELRALAATL